MKSLTTKYLVSLNAVISFYSPLLRNDKFCRRSHQGRDCWQQCCNSRHSCHHLPGDHKPGECHSDGWEQLHGQGWVCVCLHWTLSRNTSTYFFYWIITIPDWVPDLFWRYDVERNLLEMTEANAAPSPVCKRSRGVSARGLGVSPVSFTRDRESNVPGSRPPSDISLFVGIEGSLLIARGIRAGLGITH